MSECFTVINATCPAGLDVVRALLERDNETTILAQASDNLAALAPLSRAYKGRLNSYGADLADPAATELFARDSLKHFKAPRTLILLFPCCTVQDTEDAASALQCGAGSCHAICRAYFAAMEKEGGRVFFLVPAGPPRAGSPVEAMANGALRALIQFYMENPRPGLELNRLPLAEQGMGALLLEALNT